MKRSTLLFATLTLLTTLTFAACGGGNKSSGGTATAERTGTPSVEATPFPTSKPGAVLSTEEIVRKLRPSVVLVSVAGSGRDVFGDIVPSEGIGTGVIIDADGYIVTNNHVVRAGGGTIAQTINVTLYDGKELPAEVIGTDPQTDLAVIKITASNLTPAELGSTAAQRVGADVVAMGYALGLEGDPTVTRGVISAKGRSIQEDPFSINDAIQTDASINPGNSGGPLVDAFGQVVGINTAIVAQAQNIGFSISIDLVRPLAQEIIEQGRVERGYLGVNVVDVTPALNEAEGLGVDQGVARSEE